MKFQDMPYQRVDFDQVEAQIKDLMEEFDRAADGREQFAVHEKFYELTDRVNTMMTIAHIRYDVDTSDEFYSKEHEYDDEKGPVYSNLCWLIRKSCMLHPAELIWRRRSGRWPLKTWRLRRSPWMKS